MLNKTQYFIREHVGLLKLHDTYDIIDPVSNQTIGLAEEEPGWLVQLLRLGADKRALPTKVFVYEIKPGQDEAECVFSIHRGFTLLRARISVRDGDGREIGWLRRKLLTLGESFDVFNAQGEQVARVKGDFLGWNFHFLDANEREIGTITKKWAGLGKELFTSADNYMIALNGQHAPDNARLLLAAGLAIDIVFKER
ncbi:MAG TPA: phospholipid scramblase-related protein [Gallionellaceae bacterium]|nr:phospholipid scramblase-related protein [Gallionellaceae bacterium]